MSSLSSKRLYKELLDEKNYKIAMALATKLPNGMSVQELREVTGLEWTATKYRVRSLVKASLIKPLGWFSVPGRGRQKSYKIRSRTLFEYGLLEAVLSTQNGEERLADALEESMREHKVPADRMLVMNLASFTAHCVKHGFFYELREYASQRILKLTMLHKYHSEDLSIDFIKAFLASHLNRKVLPIRFGEKITVNEIRLLFDQLMRQLRRADPHKVRLLSRNE